jgi:hypothetical protein
MATTDELVYEIGIDWDKIGFGNFTESINQGVDKLAKMSAVATAAAAAAGAAIFAMGKDYANTADNLLKTSERIRTTTADIEALTFAAGDNGAGMDSITSALASLSKQQAELLRGKGDFEAWARIDVDPSKYSNTADLLGAVADGLQGIDDVEKVNILERLGISGDLLQTLSQGSEGLRAYRAEAEALGRISTPEMIKSSQEFMSGWQRASTAIDGVMNKVKASLLESTVNPAIKSFNKFVNKNMEKIAQTLTRIFEALAKASQFIFSLIHRAAIQFDRFSALIGGSERAVALLGAAMIALKWNTIKALAPAIIALGALYIAFDEIMSFMEGKESFIGDFFKLFGVSSEDSIAGIKAMGEAMIEVADMVIKGWILIFELIGKIPDAIEEAWKSIGEFTDDVKDAFDFNVSDTIDSITKGVKGFFGVDVSGAINNSAQGQLVAGAMTTNNNQITFQIDGSGSPQETADSVKTMIQNYFDEQASRVGG